MLQHLTSNEVAGAAPGERHGLAGVGGSGPLVESLAVAMVPRVHAWLPVAVVAETDGELRQRLPAPLAAGINAGLQAQVNAELEESCNRCNLTAGHRQWLPQARALKKNCPRCEPWTVPVERHASCEKQRRHRSATTARQHGASLR